MLSDDCLLSCKYIYKNKIYPVLRIQINTNFIFNNFVRIQKQEIDIAKDFGICEEQVFADFIF